MLEISERSFTLRPTAPSEKSQLEEAAAARAEGHGGHHHGPQDPDQGHGPTPAIQAEDARGAGADHPQGLVTKRYRLQTILVPEAESVIERPDNFLDVLLVLQRHFLLFNGGHFLH